MSRVGTQAAFVGAFLLGEEARSVMDRRKGESRLAEMLRRDNEALEVIRDSDLGQALAGRGLAGASPAMIDAALWRYLADYLARLERLRPPRPWLALARVYLQKYDVHNLRVILRVLHGGAPAPLIPLGNLAGRLEPLKQVVQPLSGAPTAENPEERRAAGRGAVRDELERGGLSAYRTALAPQLDLYAAELALENTYYARLETALGRHGKAARLPGILVDLRNLGHLLRQAATGRPSPLELWALEGGYLYSRRRLAELAGLGLGELVAILERGAYRAVAEQLARAGEGTLDIAVIERACAAQAWRLARNLLGAEMFGPVVMLRHLLYKECEIEAVRLVLHAVQDGLPREEVLPYLVVAA